MDTLKIDEKISEFLSIEGMDLAGLPYELVEKMRKAIDSDDYMKLHHLGYALPCKA